MPNIFELFVADAKEQISEFIESHPEFRSLGDYAEKGAGYFATRAQEFNEARVAHMDEAISRFIAYLNVAEYSLQKAVEHAPTPEARTEALQALEYVHKARNPKEGPQ